MKITELLIAEHMLLCAVFDQIERALPDLETVGEARLLGRLVESLLRGHGSREEDLAYRALDHVLYEKGHLDRLYSDHHEIDARLKQAQQAETVGEARGLLQLALAASRAHFRDEEHVILPLIEENLQSDSIGKLGELWMKHHGDLGIQTT
ncbi:MAG: hypothetical protein FJ388_12180 [Verrucomicrobia bacterium]|nr:hypothetical protein [Verrucomicrobiota bacterium]